MKIIHARSALLAAAMPLLASVASRAQEHPEKPVYKYEKCHGIVRAGKNDCFTASNSCAGTSKTDRQRDAWIYVPAGTCDRIIGGSLNPTDK